MSLNDLNIQRRACQEYHRFLSLPDTETLSGLGALWAMERARPVAQPRNRSNKHANRRRKSEKNKGQPAAAT